MNKGILRTLVVMATIVFIALGCSKGTLYTTKTGSFTQPPGLNIATVSLSVYGPKSGSDIGPLLYSDSTGKGSFNFQQNQVYTLQISSNTLPANSTFKLTTTNVGIPSLPHTTQTLTMGNNSFTASSVPGVFAMAITLINGGSTITFATKNYSLAVQCPTDNFSQSSLSNLAITATSTYGSTTSYNTFSFQVSNNGSSGVMPAANGIPFPDLGNGQYYICQLDTMGVGILNSPPQDCSKPFTVPAGSDYSTYTYTNYIGNRTLALQVTDGCGYSYTTEIPTTLPTPALVPVAGGTPAPTGMPGAYVIYGNFGQSTSSTSGYRGDVRIDNAYFIATPQIVPGDDAPQAVTLSFSNSGSFSMSSSTSYTVGGAQPVSMAVTVTGLQNNLDAVSAALNASPTPLPSASASISPSPIPTPTISVVNPTISLTFTGPRYSDITLQSPLTPALTMASAGNCSPIWVQAQIVNSPPQACASGSPIGVVQLSMVEVWGQFTCPMVSTGGSDGGGVSVQVTGGFDGMTQVGDVCGAPPPVPPPPPGGPGPV